jgi:serine/threonine protein kinase
MQLADASLDKLKDVTKQDWTSIILQVVYALIYINTKIGFVHQDTGPRNIFIQNGEFAGWDVNLHKKKYHIPGGRYKCLLADYGFAISTSALEKELEIDLDNGATDRLFKDNCDIATFFSELSIWTAFKDYRIRKYIYTECDKTERWTKQWYYNLYDGLYSLLLA